MPYEDRPLHQTVSFQIESVGAREVETEREADVLFYVYASRFEPGRAESFADEIAAKVAAGKRVSVADIDPKGDVQGADVKFTERLLSAKIFKRLYSYAAWNTAGNTVGTTLPQGMISGVKEKIHAQPKNEAAIERTQRAQDWFMLNRLFDDHVYHSIVRPEAQAFIRKNKWTTLRLTDEQARQVTEFSRERMRPAVADISRRYFQNEKCAAEIEFVLPWSRTFEAEINFVNPCPFAARQPATAAK